MRYFRKLVFALGGRRGGLAQWYDDAWSDRTEIQIDNSVNANTHVSQQYRFLLDGDDIDFATAKADGSDLRVANSNGTTLLSHYVESWDQAEEQAAVWVLAPSVSMGSRKKLWFYYGNSGASSASDYEATFIRRPAASTSGLICSCAITGSGALSNGSAITDATGNYSPVVSGTTGTRTTSYGTPGTSQTAAPDCNGLRHAWTGAGVLRFGRNQYTDRVEIDGLLDIFPTDFSIVIDCMVFDATAQGRHFSKVNADSSRGIYFDTGSNTSTIWVKTASGNIHYSMDRVSHTRMEHFVFVFRGGNFEVYRNGQYLNYPSYFTSAPTMPDLSAFPFAWNDSGDGVSNNSGSFTSRLDVYDRALTPEEAAADFYNTKHAQAAAPGTRIVRDLAPAFDFSSPVCAEPSLRAHPTMPGRVLVFYSQSGGMRIAHSDNEGAGWTDDGLTNIPDEHSSPIWDEDEGVFWVIAPHSSTHWNVYRNDLTDLINGWTLEAQIDPPTWSNGTAGGNATAFKHDGTWYAILETYTSVGGNLTWRMGLFSAPAMDGPWTQATAGPLDTLAVDDTGMCGGPEYGGYWGGRHHLLYHASPVPGNGMTQIYCATSDDLRAWIIETKWPGVQNPIIWMVDRSQEIYQVADPSLLDRPATNRTLLAWTAAIDGGTLVTFTGHFDGTPQQLFAVGKDDGELPPGTYVVGDDGEFVIDEAYRYVVEGP